MVFGHVMSVSGESSCFQILLSVPLYILLLWSPAGLLGVS